MLVLTRHANQSIMIGHDIVVTVLEVRGDQVRLGIKAPHHVEVHREEVFAALQQANRQAASPSAAALDALGGLRAPAAGEEPAGEPAPGIAAPTAETKGATGDSGGTRSGSPAADRGQGAGGTPTAAGKGKDIAG